MWPAVPGCEQATPAPTEGSGGGPPSPGILATRIAGRLVVPSGRDARRSRANVRHPPPRSSPRRSHSSLTACPGPRCAGHGRWRGGDAPSARAASLASSAALPVPARELPWPRPATPTLIPTRCSLSVSGIAGQGKLAGSSLVAGRGGPSWGQGGAARASRDDDLDAGESHYRLKQRRGSLGHRCCITSHPGWAEMDSRERGVRASSRISVLGPGPAT